MMEEFRANGALAFVIGAFIVTVHNVWTSPTAVLVSLIGWGARAEGMLPDITDRLRRIKVSILSALTGEKNVFPSI